MLRTFALLLILCAGAPLRAAVLVDPPGLPIPAGLSPAQVDKAVRLALAERRWAVQSSAAGEIIADYTPRSHVARVHIGFAGDAVRITYQSSVNLDFEEHRGQREIHRNYNVWIEQLLAAIDTQLHRSDLPLLADPPAVVPQPKLTLEPQPPNQPLTRVIAPEETLVVSAVTPYAPGVGSEFQRGSCQWNTLLPMHVGTYSRLRLQQVADSRANTTGLSLDLAVLGVHATGGGGYSGPKWARIRATVRDGATVIASNEFYRDTGRGGWTACGALERLAKAIGRDVANWLKQPAAATD